MTRGFTTNLLGGGYGEVGSIADQGEGPTVYRGG